MVDISKASQNVMKIIDEVASRDGKKGISSKEERNALAELLSSGKIQGNNNVEYVEAAINSFDLKEASENVSDFVKRAIAKAMEMAGDKNAIDNELELAVLDKIIDNTSGDFSPEDIQYAKLLKAQTKYAGQKSGETTLREENSVLAEKNQELMKENADLKAQIEQLKEHATQASAEIEKTISDNSTQIDEVARKDAHNAKLAVEGIKELSIEVSSLISDLSDKQAKLSDGKLTKSTFENFRSQIEAKIKAKKKEIRNQLDFIKTIAKKLKNESPELSKISSTLLSFATSIFGQANESASNVMKDGVSK